MSFSLTTVAIDPGSLRSRLLNEAAGAFTSYEGWVRDNNNAKEVSSLAYTSYPELAVTVGDDILAEAKQQFALLDCLSVHRTGHLCIGDIAVWVGVISIHRDHGFLACRYIIDNLKHRLPVWKKEHYADGSSEWIENRDSG